MLIAYRYGTCSLSTVISKNLKVNPITGRTFKKVRALNSFQSVEPENFSMGMRSNTALTQCRFDIYYYMNNINQPCHIQLSSGIGKRRMAKFERFLTSVALTSQVRPLWFLDSGSRMNTWSLKMSRIFIFLRLNPVKSWHKQAVQSWFSQDSWTTMSIHK